MIQIIVKLDIEVQILAKLPDKDYGDNELSFREIYFMNDFDEYVDEDNIDDVLNKADEEINADIEEDQDKDSNILLNYQLLKIFTTKIFQIIFIC